MGEGLIEGHQGLDGGTYFHVKAFLCFVVDAGNKLSDGLAIQILAFTAAAPGIECKRNFQSGFSMLDLPVNLVTGSRR